MIYALGAAIAAGSGCASRQPEQVTMLGDLYHKHEAEVRATFPPPPEAGNRTSLAAHSIEEIVASSGVSPSPRSNPFAMFPDEAAFQTGIRYRIILSKLPGMATEVEPPAPVTPPELMPVEEQPYRRVAGIVLGDTVQAVVVMEDGRGYIVRPGMRVGNTEWVCQSIDADSVVLVRQTGPLPHQVTLNLESAPPTEFGGGGNQGAGDQGGGNQGGGQPGGGRGGRRGGTGSGNSGVG